MPPVVDHAVSGELLEVTPLDLASLLEERAFGTWDRLVEGNATRMPPHEDGLTADHLSFLRSRLDPSEFVVERYSGRGEGGRRNPNVDFEWWIEQRGQVLGLRCQAKTIDVDLEAFRDLGSDRALAQALRVIENRFRAAHKHRQHAAAAVYRYPLYCLFTATHDPDVRFRESGWRRSYGCSLVAASTVLEAIWEGKTRLMDLAPALVPWAWPFVSSELSELEKQLNSRLFGAKGPGDQPQAVHDPATDPEDEAAFVSQLRKKLAGSDRYAAATNLARVSPPPSGARVSLDDAPGYVKRLGARLDLPTATGLGEDDGRPPTDLDFAALVRLPRDHDR